MTPKPITMAGELTIQTAAQTLESVRPVLGTDVAIDLSGVTEMDTAGLQILLLMKKEAAVRGATIELVTPSEAVEEVLRTAGLDNDLGVQW